jgi:hypothetical protein
MVNNCHFSDKQYIPEPYSGSNYEAGYDYKLAFNTAGYETDKVGCMENNRSGSQGLSRGALSITFTLSNQGLFRFSECNYLERG